MRHVGRARPGRGLAGARRRRHAARRGALRLRRGARRRPAPTIPHTDIGTEYRLGDPSAPGPPVSGRSLCQGDTRWWFVVVPGEGERNVNIVIVKYVSFTSVSFVFLSKFESANISEIQRKLSESLSI